MFFRQQDLLKAVKCFATKLLFLTSVAAVLTCHSLKVGKVFRIR